MYNDILEETEKLLEVNGNSGNKVDPKHKLVANEDFSFEKKMLEIRIKNLEFGDTADEADEWINIKNLDLVYVSGIVINFAPSDTST